MKDISIQELKNTAVQMRMKVIDMIYKAQSGQRGFLGSRFMYLK